MGECQNGDKYMLKLADSIRGDKRNSLNSTYSNSIYSEKVCCDILKALGFDVQDTLLGYIDRSKDGKENKLLVACKNFIPEGYELVEFKSILSTLNINIKPKKIPRLEDIYDVFGKSSVFFDDTVREVALRCYWDLFVLDALFGNFDRHGNNWGYLVNRKTREVSIAPIYDCGSCLFPQLSDSGIEEVLSSDEEINKRVNTFPTAALSVGGKKVNYKDFITSLENKDCNDAVRRIYPRINFDTIDSVIDSNLDLTDIRKKFYKVILRARFEGIIKPAEMKLRERSICCDICKEDFTDEQWNQIQWGRDSGVDTSLFAKKFFNCGQMEQIRLGLEHSLTEDEIKVYARADFDYNQMYQIRLGYEQGIDASIYAKPSNDYSDMMLFRQKLLVCKYNKIKTK